MERKSATPDVRSALECSAPAGYSGNGFSAASVVVSPEDTVRRNPFLFCCCERDRSSLGDASCGPGLRNQPGCRSDSVSSYRPSEWRNGWLPLGRGTQEGAIGTGTGVSQPRIFAD